MENFESRTWRKANELSGEKPRSSFKQILNVAGGHWQDQFMGVYSTDRRCGSNSLNLPPPALPTPPNPFRGQAKDTLTPSKAKTHHIPYMSEQIAAAKITAQVEEQGYETLNTGSLDTTTEGSYRKVLVKLVIFSLALGIAPLSSYFASEKYLWNGRSHSSGDFTFWHLHAGNSTYAAVTAIVAANIVLVAYIVMSVMEENRATRAAQVPDSKKTRWMSWHILSSWQRQFCEPFAEVVWNLYVIRLVQFARVLYFSE